MDGRITLDRPSDHGITAAAWVRGIQTKGETTVACISSRRTFVKQASLFLAGAHVAPWLEIAAAADAGSVIADTSAGKIRGLVVDDIKIFKGVPYGGTTAGTHRFMPPTKPAAWTGVRDAVAYGPTAPQPRGNGAERAG